MVDLTHVDPDGNAQMVDVGYKAATQRRAVAHGAVTLSPKALTALRSNNLKKGDPLAVAQLSGIMAAKKTADLIPLCHPLSLSKVGVWAKLSQDQTQIDVIAEVRTSGQTGVEMEALTAVSVACLTLYDMLKAVDKGLKIVSISLTEKTGGKSGDYTRSAAPEN